MSHTRTSINRTDAIKRTMTQNKDTQIKQGHLQHTLEAHTTLKRTSKYIKTQTIQMDKAIKQQEDIHTQKLKEANQKKYKTNQRETQHKQKGHQRINKKAAMGRKPNPHLADTHSTTLAHSHQNK